MRKVLSFVLVLSLVLGSFGMAFAAPLSDVKGEEFEDAVNVLTELGVVSGYPDGTYKPDNIVTRAEMAVIVVRALGLADYATGTSNFSDMAGHWSNPYVAYATSLGIIAGYPDGTFKPDKTVSYDEAATMLVAALGYTPESLPGTWPANYVTRAKIEGILDGIKAGPAGANRGDIAIMAFQTLDREIGYTNKDGEWVGAAVGQQKDTMLERLGAELYDYDGTTGSADPGDPFVLTDSHAEEAIANVREYVGAYVTAYANDKDKIIAIKEVKSTFLTGEFTTLAAAGSIATDDVFKVGDDEYTVDLVTGAVTPEEFVNGEDKTITPAFNTGAEYKIAADVSGKKIKEVYSVSFWDVDDAFLFEDDMLDDESLNSHDFVLDDNDEIDFSSFALLGVDSLEDIDEDNVVYVYNGGNSGKIARIEVGTETGSGEVTKIKGSKYTIGGKVYEFSVATGAIASRPDIDAEIEMVLDYAGDIYDYDVISGESDLYGIVLRTRVAGEDPTNLGSNDAELELFLADGTKKVFTVDYSNFAKKADGTPVASPGIPATVYDQNNTPNASYVSDDQWLIAAGDVIEYALNKDGEIEAIEWIVDADAGLAKRTADTTKVTAAADLTAKGYYQGYKVASDALIMTYGSSFTTDEDDYGVADRAKLIDSTIPANAYFVVEDGQIAFMYISDAATSADSVFGALVDAEKNNSDAGYGVDMLIDGKAVFINSNVDYRSVATYPRDLLYLVEYDVDGDVSSLTPMSLTPGTDYNRSAKTNFDADSACTLNGYVVGISNFGAADTSVFDIDDAVSGPGTVLEITLDADVAVYKWNEDDGEYKVGKLSDIKGKVAVAFFDVVDEDGVYDIVLIMDDATTPAY